METQPSPGVDSFGAEMSPQSVRVLRTLGKGRAARAQLVEATMPNGQTLQCVEKVFAPGRLTRAIYRLSFQAPFAYQTNWDAIRACFYRRRVAAAVLAASDIDAKIARPIYVRYDEPSKAWVLAAEWIDGRGIRPAATDPQRMRRWLSRRQDGPPSKASEIDELVDLMHDLETMLGECGLVGSGWQVAPRALVSTANLLRQGERYTIIDLESGIPAVLVPRYLSAGLRRAALPPFDDLDADRLNNWIDTQDRLLTFRIGPAALQTLRHDAAKLIHHTSQWKDSELALLRRPWRLLTRRGAETYQRECFRRWRQEKIVDDETAAGLHAQPLRSNLIWWSGLLPSSVGRFCGRLLGRRDYRAQVKQLICDPVVRRQRQQQFLQASQTRWIESGRISGATQLNWLTLLVHRILQMITPSGLHRFIVDRQRRRQRAVQGLLLLFSERYQSWLGGRQIELAVSRWQQSGRISEAESAELRSDLRGEEVRTYARGFGMHVALKALAPIIVPAKVGGVAAFFAGGNPWFLLPVFSTPLLRTALALGSYWTTRHQRIRHAEAIATSWLPFVGSIAFPLQMFAHRPKLSTFLIRDAASKLAGRVPIYGGTDSRTEIALIRATDFVIESMYLASTQARRLDVGRAGSETPPADVIRFQPTTRFGRWLDHQATLRIKSQETPEQPSGLSTKIAA